MAGDDLRQPVAVPVDDVERDVVEAEPERLSATAATFLIDTRPPAHPGLRGQPPGRAIAPPAVASRPHGKYGLASAEYWNTAGTAR